MTATIDPTTAYDELGAEIEPGTLCWVKTDDSVPSEARDKRCLAVFTGSIGSQPWLLLIPVAKPEDPWSRNSEMGWRLATHVTQVAMNSLNLNRFAESHRGWWVPRANIQFLETAIGYWCIDHQVFHAAETCPPSDEPDRFVENARIAQLERDLATARAETIAAVKKHEDFIIKASEVLGEEADSHDLCEVYDSIAQDAGLLPRVKNQDVEVEVTYRTTITVRARSYEEAADIVRTRAVSSFFTPPTPFVNTRDIEDHGSTYSLAVEVITD